MAVTIEQQRCCETNVTIKKTWVTWTKNPRTKHSFLLSSHLFRFWSNFVGIFDFRVCVCKYASVLSVTKCVKAKDGQKLVIRFSFLFQRCYYWYCYCFVSFGRIIQYYSSFSIHLYEIHYTHTRASFRALQQTVFWRAYRFRD